MVNVTREGSLMSNSPSQQRTTYEHNLLTLYRR
jgi:hypothetical protein